MPKMKPAKTRCSGTKTEAWFWSFLRSGLRRKFMSWPANYQCRNTVRRKYEGPNPRQKFEYLCARCASWFMQKETNVHHKEECGQLKAFSDLPGFVERLFCEPEGLEVICKKCHKETHHPKNDPH
jgi:hypothetical protein